MFDATLKDREASLQAAPWTLMFIHWLVGMVYVYYFASFILLLREVLRPGVLWFLKNLNDPDFSPVQVNLLKKILFVCKSLLYIYIFLKSLYKNKYIMNNAHLSLERELIQSLNIEKDILIFLMIL